MKGLIIIVSLLAITCYTKFDRNWCRAQNGINSLQWWMHCVPKSHNNQSTFL